MKYAIKYFNEVCIIELAGKIDYMASQFLDKILDDRISKGNNRIILDFTHVIYIGSNGFSVIINNMILCRNNNGDIKIASVNEEILDTIRKIGLDEVIEIGETLEGCLELFNSGGEYDKC